MIDREQDRAEALQGGADIDRRLATIGPNLQAASKTCALHRRPLQGCAFKGVEEAFDLVDIQGQWQGRLSHG